MSCAPPRGSPSRRPSWGGPACQWRKSPGWNWQRTDGVWPSRSAAWTPWWRSATCRWGSSAGRAPCPASLTVRGCLGRSTEYLSHTFRAIPPADEVGWVVYPVVVNPVLAAHRAALLGGHVTGDDEVPEGPVIVRQVLNDRSYWRELWWSVPTQDSWMWTLACPQWWRPEQLLQVRHDGVEIYLVWEPPWRERGAGREPYRAPPADTWGHTSHLPPCRGAGPGLASPANM